MKLFLQIFPILVGFLSIRAADCGYEGQPIESWISKQVSAQANSAISLHGNGERLQYAQTKTSTTTNIDIYQVAGVDKVTLDTLWNRESQCDSLIANLIKKARQLQIISRSPPEGFFPLFSSEQKPKECIDILQIMSTDTSQRPLHIQSYGRELFWGNTTIHQLLEQHKTWDVFMGCEKDRTTVLFVAPGLGFLHILEIPKFQKDKMSIRLHIPWEVESSQDQLIPTLRKPKYTIQRSP